MNNLYGNPLHCDKLAPDKSSEFNHSDEEFEEVLEDGLKLNDQVLQLKKQVKVQEQDNSALIKRNMELESENSKLKAMLAKAKVDFTKQEDTTESDMVNEPPHYRQHAMECFDEMFKVFCVEAAKYLKKLSELDVASIFENEPDDD